MSAITSPSLLEALADPGDDVAWRRFVDRYEPMLQAFARRLGIGDSDAFDVGQETLCAFLKAWRKGRYDRSKGRLRSWLFGIARNKAMDMIRQRRHEQVFADRSDGSAFLAAIPGDEDLTHSWEKAWQEAKFRHCLEAAARRARPVAVECFRLYVLEQWKAEDVAHRLQMCKDAVYRTKNRMLARIKECADATEERWQEARL